MRLADFRAAHDLGSDQAVMDAIVDDTRRAAYHIIERKGATYYAVAAGLLRILEAILRDQATVLSVSSLVPPQYGVEDVCLSVPTVITRQGIERVLVRNEETVWGLDGGLAWLANRIERLAHRLRRNSRPG